MKISHLKLWPISERLLLLVSQEVPQHSFHVSINAHLNIILMLGNTGVQQMGLKPAYWHFWKARSLESRLPKTVCDMCAECMQGSDAFKECISVTGKLKFFSPCILVNSIITTQVCSFFFFISNPIYGFVSMSHSFRETTNSSKTSVILVPKILICRHLFI